MFKRLEKYFYMLDLNDFSEDDLNKLGLPTLWNNPVLDLEGTVLKNTIPRVWKGVSAYVVVEGKLYYLAEDDSRFWELSRIYHIDEIRKVYKKIQDFLEERKKQIKKYGKVMFSGNGTIREVEDGIVAFALGTVLRYLSIEWLEDELYLMQEVIAKYDEEYGYESC